MWYYGGFSEDIWKEMLHLVFCIALKIVYEILVVLKII